MIVKCDTCGKELNRPPCNVNPWKRHFCSKTCREPAETRFWTKVQKTDGCWIWTACSYPYGYGAFRVNRKSVAAHIYAWELQNGPVPDGLEVCHKCDNPPCVRPDHMFLGTHEQNMKDAVKKGRTPQGSRHWASRLTEDQVIEIRRLFDTGTRIFQIANFFGVAWKTIEGIVKRKRWHHVK